MAATPPLDSYQKSHLEIAKADLQALIQKLDGIYVRFLYIVGLLCCFLLTLVPQNIVLRLERSPPEHMLFYANLPDFVAVATRLEERLASFDGIEEDKE
jgi:hypothetical protein